MKRRLRLFCLVCCALLLPLFPAGAAGTAQNIRVLLKRPGFTDRADLYLSGAYTVAWGGSEAAFRDGSRVTAQVRDGVRGSGVIFEKYAVFRVFIHFPHIAAARMAFA